MFLISKSGRRRAICAECRKLHAAKDCPKAKATVRSHDEFMDMIRLAKQINEERYAAMGKG